VEHGADINKKINNNGVTETPLSYACRIENNPVVKYLAKLGAK